MSSTAGGPRSDREERGVTPLVGIVLLFGMVFAGAALLFIVWYNASEQGAIPWDDEGHEPCSASVDELGTIEYEAGDRTVAYQGGGVFERTSSDTLVRSPPGVGFDDDRLQLSVMKIDWSHDGGDAVARKNLTASRMAVEELSGASRDCEMDTEPGDPPREDLALRIESEYAAGWERHLENEAELTDRDVEVDRDGDVVTMEAMGLGDTPDPATFRISEDLGSPDYPDPNDVRVTFPSESPAPHPVLNWTAEFENTGDESIARDVTFELLGEGIEDTERLELGPGKSEVQEFQIPPGHYKELSPGQEYEYDIYVENDEDSLDTYGSFYYGKEGTHFDVVDIVEPDGDEVAIGARLQNLGVENGTEEATIQIHHETGGEIVSSNRDLTLEYGQDATITWSIDESEWPNEKYEFSVTTDSDGDGESGEFEITEGYDDGLVVTEDRGIAGGEQAVTEDEDVVVEAEITNTGFEELEGPVTLELFDENGDGVGDVETTVSVDGSDTERVELTVADPGLVAGEIYEYDVTADDGLDDRGSFLVVEERAVPEFSIEEVDLDDPVKPGSPLEVAVDLENAGDAGEELVWLEGFDGDAVAVQEVELEDEEETITLVWEDVAVPDPIDETTVTVRTGGDEESVEVDVEPLLLVDDVEVVEQEEFVVTDDAPLTFNGDVYVDTERDASDFGVDGDAEKTVAAKVYTEDFDGGGVFEMGEHDDSQDFSLRTLTDEDEWRGQFWGDADIDFDYDSKDEWVHFTVTWDGQETVIYADGEEVASSENDLDTSDENPFTIGQWDGDRFSGDIEDVRLYDRSLSEDEAETLANGTDVDDGLVGHWPLETVEGTTTEDVSGNGYDGTVYGVETSSERKLDLTIEADLSSVAGTASQEVVLEGFDGEEVASDSVTVSEGGSDTVEFGYTTDPDPITDRVTVRTEDDVADALVVVERDGPVCGEVGYAGEGTADQPYEVSTVDQLQCIDDHDLDAHYVLVDDIDAHGTEFWNDGAGFEPIGEQEDGGEEFSGGFDGAGNKIESLHVDRPDEDFVGIFAVTAPFHDGNADPVGEGTTVENLRVENVSVHGQQVTGGVIGGAGGPVENVRVSGTVEAEHQEVGGIVGHSHNADLDNRLVSEATVRGGVPAAAVDGVSHPWGADNMGIGGIVGGTGFNTRVSTAYSQADVEGPFAVGGVVGWTSDFASDNEQMYWADGSITITATQDEIDDYQSSMGRLDYPDQENTGGAMFGRGDDGGDFFADSVYVNTDFHEHAFGEHVRVGTDDPPTISERTTSEMQGLDATEPGNMGNLDYEEDGGPWVAIPDDYPRFAWELAAEGAFEVEIDDVGEDVTAGEFVEVDVMVTSRYADRDETNVTQTIALENPDGETVDTRSVELPSTLEVDEEETITLVWRTNTDDDGDDRELTVRSEDAKDTALVDIDDLEIGPGSSSDPDREFGLGDGEDEPGEVPDVGTGESTAGDGPESEPDVDIDGSTIVID